MSDDGVSRRGYLQLAAVVGGVAAGTVHQSGQSVSEMLPSGGGGGETILANVLDVASGETHHIESGETEQYERADINGTLDIDGHLRLTG